MLIVLLLGIAVPCLIGLLVGLIVLVVEENKAERASNATLAFLGVSIALAIVIWVLLVGPLWLGIGISTAGRARQLEVFYNENARVYEQAVGALYSGVPSDSSEMKFVEGPNLEQIQAYQETVVSMRDSVVTYNTSLQNHRYWQDHLLGGWFYNNVSADIDFIGEAIAWK